MVREKELNYFEFKKWVRLTNIRWLPYLNLSKYFGIILRRELGKIKREIFN